MSPVPDSADTGAQDNHLAALSLSNDTAPADAFSPCPGVSSWPRTGTGVINGFCSVSFYFTDGNLPPKEKQEEDYLESPLSPAAFPHTGLKMNRQGAGATVNHAVSCRTRGHR